MTYERKPKNVSDMWRFLHLSYMRGYWQDGVLPIGN